MGYYLEDNKPVKTQFRARRSTVRPVIVLHTAESGLDLDGGDGRAEAVARFISRRTTYGSYHILTDRDSVIPLVRFSNAAFGDGTGSNEWAVHISIAMNAAAWPTLSDGVRDQYLAKLVEAANLAADWFEQGGHPRPAAARLTRSASDRSDASGFIGHGDRDPGRRSDPGAGFPWDLFLARYAGDDMGTPASPLIALQAIVRAPQTGEFDADTRAALKGQWLGYPSSFGAEVAGTLVNTPELVKWAQARLRYYEPGLAVDGHFGPKTEAVVSKNLRKGAIIDLGLYRWLSKL